MATSHYRDRRSGNGGLPYHVWYGGMLIKILEQCLTMSDLERLLESYKANKLQRTFRQWLKANRVGVPAFAEEVGLITLGQVFELVKSNAHAPVDLLLREFHDPRPLPGALKANKALLRRLSETPGAVDLEGSLRDCDRDDARVWILHLFRDKDLVTGLAGKGRVLRPDGTVNGNLLRAYLLEDMGIDLGVRTKPSETVIDVSEPKPAPPAKPLLTVVQGALSGIAVTHRAYVTPEEAAVLVEVAEGRLNKGVGARLGILAQVLKKDLGILKVTGHTKAAETSLVREKAQAILFVACPDTERRSPRRAASLRKGMSVPPERWLEDLKRIAAPAAPKPVAPPTEPAPPPEAKPAQAQVSKRQEPSVLSREAVERKLSAARDELAEKEAQAQALRERVGNLEFLLANFDKLVSDD